LRVNPSGFLSPIDQDALSSSGRFDYQLEEEELLMKNVQAAVGKSQPISREGNVGSAQAQGRHQ
jgi:hypothetical protein